MLSDFFSLFYPKLCAGCRKTLLKSERAICLECQYEFASIPITQKDNNPIAKIFWGRVPLNFAVSTIAFNKGHRIQKVLHAIKYEGNQNAAHEMGQLLGFQLKTLNVEADVIIPLPLHTRRQKLRGYNQSELIAEGTAEVLRIPVENNAVKRLSFESSQTGKNREDRWENVATVFKLKSPDLLVEQKILLIDDVLTTGATLEACARTLLDGPVKSVGVATLACVL